MYQDLLGRNPDPGGLAHWLTALNNGSSTFAVAAGIVISTEREIGLIRGDYALYLGRLPRTDERPGPARMPSSVTNGPHATSVSSRRR